MSDCGGVNFFSGAGKDFSSILFCKDRIRSERERGVWTRKEKMLAPKELIFIGRSALGKVAA